MTLDEFVQREKCLLERFEAGWKYNHRIWPDLYPMEMDQGDASGWDEQFRSFEETTDGQR